MPELWVPGFAGPLDDLVDRIHRRIEQFAEEAGVERPSVEVELADGARYDVEALTAEPGYGFVTIRPHAGDDVPGRGDRPDRVDQAHRAQQGRGGARPARLLAAVVGTGFSLSLLTPSWRVESGSD